MHIMLYSTRKTTPQSVSAEHKEDRHTKSSGTRIIKNIKLSFNPVCSSLCTVVQYVTIKIINGTVATQLS